MRRQCRRAAPLSPLVTLHRSGQQPRVALLRRVRGRLRPCRHSAVGAEPTTRYPGASRLKQAAARLGRIIVTRFQKPPLLDFEMVLRQLDRQGFAVESGTVRAAELAILIGGGHLRHDYSGTSTSTLRPHSTEEAPVRSLSAVYGLGPQPLHSDGAHLPHPPDVIVLHSARPSPTATVLWPITASGPPDHVRFGVFTVHGNGVTFLASAYQEGRLRFDPVAMTPGDALAHQTVEFFDARRQEAHVHEWTEPDTLLFIDNRKTLHARNAVVDADSRELTRLAFDFPEAT